MKETFAGGYTTRQVARLLGIPGYVVRGYVRSGLVFPRRGRRREFRFSFQDLVVLRTAVELSSHIPTRKVRKDLKRFKKRLPSGNSLSTLHISAEGERVVVRERDASWTASGQRLFNFDVSELAGQAAPLARLTARKALKADRGMDAEAWYEMGCELEPVVPAEAIDAYQKAVQVDPAHVGAQINLGRLRHEGGQHSEAVFHYRSALQVQFDPVAAFNLGVVLQDMGRSQEAIQAYQQVLQHDPSFADAHYNLSRLFERAGQKREALRHMTAYRKLLKP